MHTSSPQSAVLSIVRIALLALLSLGALTSCEATHAPYRDLEPEQLGHMDSGFLFPVELAAFKRGELTTLNEEGTDVGVTYTRFHPWDRLNASVFVYPALPLKTLGSTPEQIRVARSSLLKRAFKVVELDIVKASPGATIVFADDSVVTLFGQERDALMANFTFTQKVGPIDVLFFSTATLIALDQWLVLIRLTAPNDSFGRSLVEVTEFYQALLEANEGGLRAGE